MLNLAIPDGTIHTICGNEYKFVTHPDKYSFDRESANAVIEEAFDVFRDIHNGKVEIRHFYRNIVGKLLNDSLLVPLTQLVKNGLRHTLERF